VADPVPLPPADLRLALDRFGAALDALRFLPGTAHAARWEDQRQWCRRLFVGKIRLEACGGRSPLKLVVAGGTNVGKSTLYNRIVGEPISAMSPLARFTKSAVLFVHAEAHPETVPAEFLPGYPREFSGEDSRPVGGSPGDAERRPSLHCRLHRREAWREAHLLDSPDIDSTFARNLSTAEDLFFLADGVLFVTTPEKYNDEICVHYMKRVVQYGKRLWVLLNKCTDEEVGRDLRNEIVAGLAAGGGSIENVVVLDVPFLRHPAQEEGPWLDALRAIPVEALADPAAKARAFRGALRHLEQDVTGLLHQVQLEQTYLDEFRNAVTRFHEEAIRNYLGFLEGLEFTELDQVYDRVLREFRVPVLDDVYDALGSFSRKMLSRVRSLAGAPAKSTQDRKLEERRDRDREKVKTIFQALHHEVVQLAERAPADLAPVVRTWIPPQAPVEQLNLLVQTFLSASDEVTQRWIEEEKSRLLEVLRNKPGTKRLLRTVRGVMQLGFGMMSAYLTGGINVTDLLIGPLAERTMKNLLEMAGGSKFYLDLRGKFLADRLDMFRRFLDRRIADPVRMRMPEPLPPGARVDLVGALDLLRSIEPAPAPAEPAVAVAAGAERGTP